MNGLRVYRSSAGSGKTYMLVLEYLKLVLRNPHEFRHILAITFTNKAAEEMKNRIISALKELSEEKNKPLRQQLRKYLPGSVDIKRDAALCLTLILHNYSDFSVTTIDSFFLRIIRSVAKEMNIPAGIDVEIDEDKVIESISDELFADTGTDEKLTRWLTNLVMQKMSDDGHWRIDREIETIARQLFKEDSAGLMTNGISHEAIDNLFSKLIVIRNSFEKIIKENGAAAMQAVDRSGLTAKDFHYGQRGVIGYFEKLSKGARGKNVLPGSYADKAHNEGVWCSDKSELKDKINLLAKQELQPRLAAIYSAIKNDGEKYFSAIEVLRYIYLLGITGDLGRKLAEYRGDNKVMLIADNARLISEFISADDTPFVFDKTGTRYRHFLIDEFQDTSVLQWKNLLPLIRNSLAEGNFTLIVGDVKQSIYRWRGGETRLLAGEIKNNLREFSSLITEDSLTINRRSKKNIVTFNNCLFSAALSNLNSIYANSFTDLYSEYDVIQGVDEKNAEGGYVEVDFSETDAKNFKEHIMQKALGEIRELLNEGFEYRDIALLFRNNADGNAMAEFLLRNGISKVISPDSLLLTTSPAVRFIVSAMRYILNPTDVISKKHLHYYYAQSIKQKEAPALHPVFSDGSIDVKEKNNSPTLFDVMPFENNRFNKTLPEEFVLGLQRLLSLPVFELSEELLRIFSLNKKADAFIQRFQDCVLDHSRQRNSSILSFLEWWDENKSKDGNSVLLPESENAIRIMTIHKAKGLQFPVVFIPFFNWNIFPPEELMWISSPTDPFSEAQMFPVRYGSGLEKTFFKNDFLAEKRNYVSDALNLMYVACTRAMERMYIYSDKVKTQAEPKKVSEILGAALNEMNEGRETKGFYLGEKVKVQRDTAASGSSEIFEEYISTDWRTKISVADKSQSMGVMAKEYMKKINFGTAAHKTMSYIKVPGDLDAAINKLFYSGMLSEETRLALTVQFNKLFETDPIKRFFTDEWQMLAEREIIFPGAPSLRPDRILIKGQHAVILDFKTGKEKPQDAAQIKHYAAALEQIGYQPVEKYLVYLADGKVIPV